MRLIWQIKVLEVLHLMTRSLFFNDGLTTSKALGGRALVLCTVYPRRNLGFSSEQARENHAKSGMTQDLTLNFEFENNFRSEERRGGKEC